MHVTSYFQCTLSELQYRFVVCSLKSVKKNQYYLGVFQTTVLGAAAWFSSYSGKSLSTMEPENIQQGYIWIRTCQTQIHEVFIVRLKETSILLMKLIYQSVGNCRRIISCLVWKFSVYTMKYFWNTEYWQKGYDKWWCYSLVLHNLCCADKMSCTSLNVVFMLPGLMILPFWSALVCWEVFCFFCLFALVLFPLLTIWGKHKVWVDKKLQWILCHFCKIFFYRFHPG